MDAIVKAPVKYNIWTDERGGCVCTANSAAGTGLSPEIQSSFGPGGARHVCSANSLWVGTMKMPFPMCAPLILWRGAERSTPDFDWCEGKSAPTISVSHIRNGSSRLLNDWYVSDYYRRIPLKTT